MKIRLTKEADHKSGTTTFLRDDGSCTWQKSSAFFAKHDLIHYAVETTLGYREAFLGFVAGGRDLDSFGTRNGVKDLYTQQELWTEAIVGICQWTDTPLSNEELRATLMQTFDSNIGSAPDITERQLSEIRARAQELHHQWDLLPQGGTMELTF
jgi:hypothetical protein